MTLAYSVGQKGQVVIAKKIRERLGIEPGWISIQTVVGDHVEIYFLPPPHNRSLKGSLSRYAKEITISDEDWGEIKDRAWADSIREEYQDYEPKP